MGKTKQNSGDVEQHDNMLKELGLTSDAKKST
jgi:hypothetical protein